MMISFRTADLATNLRFRDFEVTVKAFAGQSTPTTPYFVKFEKPECENETVREAIDARLRGILEAKSYVKTGNLFVLTNLPSMAACESAFMDVYKYLKHHNSVISAVIDSPVKWAAGSKVKILVIRMKTRG